MGKGDKKTAKGKRFKGSYGVSRMRKSGNGIYVPKKTTVKAKIEETGIDEPDTVNEAAVKDVPKSKKPAAKKTAAKKPAKKAAAKKTKKAKK